MRLEAEARGAGLPSVADALDQSRATVRTHLQRAFEKTGTSRQAELVAHVLSGPLRFSLPGELDDAAAEDR